MVSARDLLASLNSHGIFGQEADVALDESLFDTGVLDSLGMMSLVEFIKSEYKVKVRDVDLLPENFDTIEAIASYINSHSTSS